MSTKPTRRIPVLTDSSLDRAFSVKYGIYALFGLSGLLTHIPSIAKFAGEWAAMVLSSIVMLAGVIAAVAAWNSAHHPRWMRAEFFATITLVTFVAMYDIALIFLATQGDVNRINLAIIASALLVMPIWRIRHLMKQIRHA